jgi:hypothetical protein
MNPDVTRAYIFGSYAKGGIREDSDIDLAIPIGTIALTSGSAGSFVILMHILNHSSRRITTQNSSTVNHDLTTVPGTARQRRHLTLPPARNTCPGTWIFFSAENGSTWPCPGPEAWQYSLQTPGCWESALNKDQMKAHTEFVVINRVHKKNFCNPRDKAP